jgi:hypothetical protein
MRSTGASYTKSGTHKQGEAFYKMRYGFLLSLIATIKLGTRKKSFMFIINTIRGYYKALRNRKPYSVSKEEGVFIRKLRWKGIKNKLF